jgi:hypothetical protein
MDTRRMTTIRIVVVVVLGYGWMTHIGLEMSAFVNLVLKPKLSYAIAAVITILIANNILSQAHPMNTAVICVITAIMIILTKRRKNNGKRKCSKRGC